MLVFIHFDFLAYRSVAPSIFNIKAQGLDHCLYQIKLGLDEVYDVLFHAVWPIPKRCATKLCIFDKSQRCFQEETIVNKANKSTQLIQQLVLCLWLGRESLSGLFIVFKWRNRCLQYHRCRLFQTKIITCKSDTILLTR